jgi:hypothetical protein
MIEELKDYIAQMEYEKQIVRVTALGKLREQIPRGITHDVVYAEWEMANVQLVKFLERYGKRVHVMS